MCILRSLWFKSLTLRRNRMQAEHFVFFQPKKTPLSSGGCPVFWLKDIFRCFGFGHEAEADEAPGRNRPMSTHHDLWPTIPLLGSGSILVTEIPFNLDSKYNAYKYHIPGQLAPLNLAQPKQTIGWNKIILATGKKVQLSPRFRQVSDKRMIIAMKFSGHSLQKSLV